MTEFRDTLTHLLGLAQADLKAARTASDGLRAAEVAAWASMTVPNASPPTTSPEYDVWAAAWNQFLPSRLLTTLDRCQVHSAREA